MVRTRFELLNPHAQEAIAFATAIERAGRQVLAARRGLAAAHGLTVPAWRLLTVILRMQGRTSHARIACRMRISRQAVRDMAADLRERGFLSTSPGPTNRKEKQLVLTPQGHLAMSKLDETLRFLLLEMTNELPRDTLTAAAELLNGFSTRLRACETVLGRR